MRTRASSSERAREYRQSGHDNATLFALELGLGDQYRNDPQAKKDVIDPSGDAHSVKSGQKWQIFLYSRTRFLADDGFQALNGIGGLLVHCIDAFPPSFSDYVKDKAAAKIRLQTPMREIKDRLQRKALLRAFLMKSLFNGGEVNYLTVFDGTQFHVFLNKDVVRIMGDAFDVVNSSALRAGEFADQKVLLRCDGLNVGELEMRNDSARHYQEVRFNMIAERATGLLRSHLGTPNVCKQSAAVLIYGDANKRFGRWAQVVSSI